MTWRKDSSIINIWGTQPLRLEGCEEKDFNEAQLGSHIVSFMLSLECQKFLQF